MDEVWESRPEMNGDSLKQTSVERFTCRLSYVTQSRSLSLANYAGVSK